MNHTKYFGMGAHKETISIAVRNSSARVVMESTIETNGLIDEDSLAAGVKICVTTFGSRAFE